MRNSLNLLTSMLVLALTLTVFSAPALAFPGYAASKGQSKSDGPVMIALKGTVSETMDAGGYTYLLVKYGEHKVWAAIPKTKLKVGQEVKLAPGMTMKNFTSKSLHRTFEAIVFSRGVTTPK
jgi:hypothetical protein